MLINADFSLRIVIRLDQRHWVASPQNGVERVMLDRVGGEAARATSFVRYNRDSVFPLHRHPRGEEILVLEGTFSEAGRDYQQGWYLRNPPGSAHGPLSRDRTLDMPTLILPAVQVNIRAGSLPEPDDNGTRYLKIPLDALWSAHLRKTAPICLPFKRTLPSGD
ncbi:TPA: cupin domain-containing protein [Burkholderia vietnamiensis]|nr:cupin domain-containing protein [Burkholderia vietnamiensis]HDR8918324.1 cupin domain-containing protein [Burkholderia vietnamiensis]HDR8976622.1 cupin domain-containing protein [Burkholderia vietnamiensis]HDR9067130.1 cupin domain-containing protein [Burkholderia vietnamiensis]HDR9278298.1 cupin domain-containing protein [Burkholderia vietnamiensis]